MSITIEQMLKQYKNHTHVIGDAKVITVEGHIHDIFFGMGWENHARFRVVRDRITKNRMLVQLKGLAISPTLADKLIKEL